MMLYVLKCVHNDLSAIVGAYSTIELADEALQKETIKDQTFDIQCRYSIQFVELDVEPYPLRNEFLGPAKDLLLHNMEMVREAEEASK